MDIYHIWSNLKDGVRDTEFSDRVHDFLGNLKENGSIAAYRLTRRTLGFGAPGLPEFHIMIEVENMAQLDEAFNTMAARSGPAEDLHHAVNSLVTDIVVALYRDFPDAVRQRGDEKF